MEFEVKSNSHFIRPNLQHKKHLYSLHLLSEQWGVVYLILLEISF